MSAEVSIGTGIVPPNRDAKCIFRGATSAPAGTVVALCIYDHAVITADSLTPNVQANGLENSMWSSVTSAYSLGATYYGIFGVLLEDAVDLGVCRVRFKGIADANYQRSANTAFAVGVEFGVAHASDGSGQTTGYFNSLATPGSAVAGRPYKLFGHPLEAGTASPTSTGERVWVMFDGINGVGSSNV